MSDFFKLYDKTNKHVIVVEDPPHTPCTEGMSCTAQDQPGNGHSLEIAWYKCF